MPELDHGRDRFLPSLPYHVIWGITSACNASCSRCYAGAGSRSAGEISTKRAFEILEELSRIGIFDIAFTGGEPLMRKDLFKLIEKAASLDMEPGLSTNGSLLDRKMAAKLRDSGISRVQVSIDGIGKKHDSLRGMKGLFDMAVNALENCAAEEVPTVICFTVSRENMDQLKDVMDLGLSRGVADFNISIFVPTGRGDRRMALLPEDTERLYSFWNEHRMSGKKPWLKFHTAKMDIVAHKPLPPSHIGCQAGCGTSYIDPLGNVAPCVLLPLPIGNLQKNSFFNVWTTSGLNQRLRERNLEGKCSSCTYKNTCGGCRAMAYAQTGNLFGEDQSCWMKEN
ncbi:MAG: radical SAM protein [Deltaproteobacteria bacterium]|nr:radical SAM protein [Deltaproteobacteria bacterium]